MSSDVDITIAESTRTPPTDAGMPMIGRPIDLLPHGTQFSQPATLSIPVAPVYRRVGMPLWFLKWSGDGTRIDLLTDGQIVGDRFEVALSTFSTGYMSAGALGPVAQGGPIGPPGWPAASVCPHDPPSWAWMCPRFIADPQPPVVYPMPGDPSGCVGCYVAVGGEFRDPLATTGTPIGLASFQWLRNGVDMPGQIGAFLILPAVTPADDGAYSVRVVNAVGLANTSFPKTISVLPPGPPTITTPPADATVPVGGQPVFKVTAAGSGTLTYKWFRNGVEKPGATGDTLTDDPVVAGDDGRLYVVEVANAGGSVRSAAAQLHVLPVLQVPAQPHQLAAGAYNGALIQSDGSLRVWGADLAGGLGDGVAPHDFWGADFGPFTAQGLADVRSVVASATGRHLLAIVGADEQVWGWGASASGQVGEPLGNGTRDAPARIGSLNQVRAIAAGETHSLALQADGTLWAWGSNGSGQLGLGPLGRQTQPMRVPLLPPAVAVAAGYSHSLAVAADNTVWAWGANGACQIGDGTQVDRGAPVQISGFAGKPVVAVAAGIDFSLALTADGEVWLWGLDIAGPQAFGAPVGRQCTPAPLAWTRPVQAIAAGGYFGLALDDQRTAFAWGVNRSGAVAASTSGSEPPRAVATQVDEIAAAFGTSLWLHANEVFGRGYGGNGTLGSQGIQRLPADANFDTGIAWR